MRPASLKQIFDHSYFRVMREKRDGVEFFPAFYKRLSTRSARIEDKFAGINLAQLARTQRPGIYHLLTYFDTDEPSEYLRHLAALHGPKHLDIAPELLDLWLDAILETVQEFDPEYDKQVEAAWWAVLQKGIGFLKDAYAAQAAGTEE